MSAFVVGGASEAILVKTKPWNSLRPARVQQAKDIFDMMLDLEL
jgi:hypothetical protein